MISCLRPLRQMCVVRPNNSHPAPTAYQSQDASEQKKPALRRVLSVFGQAPPAITRAR